MIITRTPFRISFAGGGSDLPSYYSRRPGAVLSTAIDKHVYLAVKEHFRPDLHVRPLVIPRGVDLTVCNRTPDVDVAVIVDGHPLATTGRDGVVAIRLGDQRSLLATLPETTFFARFRETFVG